MIIFGSRPKNKTLDEGQFFCPRCQAQRAYKHQQATRYFTLYFIPLIPMGKMGEFIECQGCGSAFEMSVLQQQPTRSSQQVALPLTQMINTISARLRSGTPVEYMVRDLTAAGIDRDAALKLVTPHLSAGHRTCTACGLSYDPQVTICSGCQRPL